MDSSSNLLLPSTQFDMHSSENSGLVKFDILGLNTLTVINKTIEILRSKNIEIDISKIPLDDKEFIKCYPVVKQQVCFN